MRFFLLIYSFLVAVQCIILLCIFVQYIILFYCTIIFEVLFCSFFPILYSIHCFNFLFYSFFSNSSLAYYYFCGTIQFFIL